MKSEARFWGVIYGIAIVATVVGYGTGGFYAITAAAVWAVALAVFGWRIHTRMRRARILRDRLDHVLAEANRPSARYIGDGWDAVGRDDIDRAFDTRPAPNGRNR